MFEKNDASKKYPFIISNTDREYVSGTHSLSILNISLTSELLFFDSFWIAGLKNLKDNKKIINKFLKGIEKRDRVDQKLTLQKMKFSMHCYKKLTNNVMLSLSETTRYFFYLLESFDKNENIEMFVNVWLLEDPIQKTDTSTCGLFQLYFYEKVFSSDQNSKLHPCIKLTNLAIEALLKELFALD